MRPKKTVILFLLFFGFAITNAMAKGSVDIYLRCNTPSAMIDRTLGNSSYAGVEKRYPWSRSQNFQTGTSSDGGYTYTSRVVEDGYVDVGYRTVTPYVLRDDVFKSNPNYYRQGMSGSGSDGWWIFSDSASAEYPPHQYHQYATPTTSKNTAVIGTYYGQIKLTYKRFDGSTGEKVINVQIQKRECEAYNNGKWREVSPGRWEQK